MIHVRCPWLTWLVVAVMALHLLAESRVASAQTTAPASLPSPTSFFTQTPPVGSRGPIATWTFSCNPNINAIEITPDGKSAYVSMNVVGVNLWAVLIRYWPEECAAFVAIFLIMTLRKTIRHEQVEGEPHCRKCKYQLTQTDAERCPECGVELDSRTRVTGTKRPLVLAGLVVIFAIQLAMSIAVPDGLWRGDSLAGKVNWTSCWLHRWVNRYWPGAFLKCSVQNQRVVELDMATGATLRTIINDLGHHPYRQLLISRDGKRLLAVATYAARSVGIGAAQNGPSHRFTFPEVIWSVQLDATGTEFHAVSQDIDYRCDLVSGRILEVPSRPQWLQSYQLISVPDSSKSLCLHYPEDWDGSGAPRLILSTWDWQSQRLLDSHELHHWMSSYGVIGPDGRRMVSTQSPGVMVVLDTKTGAISKLERLPVAVASIHPQKISNDSRLLACANTLCPTCTEILDLDEARHVLTLATVGKAGFAAFSPDRSRALILSGARGVDSIQVFDIRDIAPTAQTSPSNPAN